MVSEINVREAINLTGYSRQQIYNLVSANRVQARKEGHELRINPRTLLSYFKNSRKNRGA